MPPKPKRKPTALGAYIFAGGFTLGVQKHFRVLGHLEEGNYGVATVRKNFPGLPVHVGVESWPLGELKALAPDLVYGNPPCAPWSRSGPMVRGGGGAWQDDPRLSCVMKHLNLLTTLRPRAWVWESVVGAFTRGREFVDQVTGVAVGAGYGVSYVLHDAKWLGVPQHRQRFFMVAHLNDIDWGSFRFPEKPLAADEVLGKVTPCGEVFSVSQITKLPAAARSRIFRDLRSGETLRSAWERYELATRGKLTKTTRGTVAGRPSFGHHRLRPGQPSTSVVGYAKVHPTEHRFLTVRELQVLNGFPPDYEFVGPPSAKPSLMARGVCPPVGEWLAGMVAASFRRPGKSSAGFVTTVDLRKPGIAQETRRYA